MIRCAEPLHGHSEADVDIRLGYVTCNADDPRVPRGVPAVGQQPRQHQVHGHGDDEQAPTPRPPQGDTLSYETESSVLFSLGLL